LSRDERERLIDILDALEAIADYAGGRLEDVSIDEPVVLDAVLLRLIVIGEAIKSLGPDLRERTPDIPWGKYAGLRDVIAHQYFRIQTQIIENTIRRDLPQLRRAVRQLLAQTDA
jgi:uncharacterized protein with HEPN domain